MKIGISLPGFNISSKGMSIQKKKMDLIAENIANIDSTKMPDGQPYKRKTVVVSNVSNLQSPYSEPLKISLKVSSNEHLVNNDGSISEYFNAPTDIKTETVNDNTQGELVYMPEHPDANEEGYLQLPNVNVINEMVDMIAATRGYEANLTAFNSSKQIAKDSMDI